MTERAADVAEWECELDAPNYSDTTLHEIYDDVRAGLYDTGDLQAYALEFIAQIRKDSRELHAAHAQIEQMRAVIVGAQNLRDIEPVIQGALPRHAWNHLLFVLLEYEALAAAPAGEVGE